MKKIILAISLFLIANSTDAVLYCDPEGNNSLTVSELLKDSNNCSNYKDSNKLFYAFPPKVYPQINPKDFSPSEKSEISTYLETTTDPLSFLSDSGTVPDLLDSKYGYKGANEPFMLKTSMRGGGSTVSRSISKLQLGLNKVEQGKIFYKIKSFGYSNNLDGTFDNGDVEYARIYFEKNGIKYYVDQTDCNGNVISNKGYIFSDQTEIGNSDKWSNSFCVDTSGMGTPIIDFIHDESIVKSESYDSTNIYGGDYAGLDTLSSTVEPIANEYNLTLEFGPANNDGTEYSIYSTDIVNYLGTDSAIDLWNTFKANGADVFGLKKKKLNRDGFSNWFGVAVGGKINSGFVFKEYGGELGQYSHMCTDSNKITCLNKHYMPIESLASFEVNNSGDTGLFLGKTNSNKILTILTPKDDSAALGGTNDKFLSGRQQIILENITKNASLQMTEKGRDIGMQQTTNGLYEFGFFAGDQVPYTKANCTDTNLVDLHNCYQKTGTENIKLQIEKGDTIKGLLYDLDGSSSYDNINNTDSDFLKNRLQNGEFNIYLYTNLNGDIDTGKEISCIEKFEETKALKGTAKNDLITKMVTPIASGGYGCNDGPFLDKTSLFSPSSPANQKGSVIFSLKLSLGSKGLVDIPMFIPIFALTDGDEGANGMRQKTKEAAYEIYKESLNRLENVCNKYVTAGKGDIIFNKFLGAGSSCTELKNFFEISQNDYLSNFKTVSIGNSVMMNSREILNYVPNEIDYKNLFVKENNDAGYESKTAGRKDLLSKKALFGVNYYNGTDSRESTLPTGEYTGQLSKGGYSLINMPFFVTDNHGDVKLDSFIGFLLDQGKVAGTETNINDLLVDINGDIDLSKIEFKLEGPARFSPFLIKDAFGGLAPNDYKTFDVGTNTYKSYKTNKSSNIFLNILFKENNFQTNEMGFAFNGKTMLSSGNTRGPGLDTTDTDGTDPSIPAGFSLEDLLIYTKSVCRYPAKKVGAVMVKESNICEEVNFSGGLNSETAKDLNILATPDEKADDKQYIYEITYGLQNHGDEDLTDVKIQTKTDSNGLRQINSTTFIQGNDPKNVSTLEVCPVLPNSTIIDKSNVGTTCQTKEKEVKILFKFDQISNIFTSNQLDKEVSGTEFQTGSGNFLSKNEIIKNGDKVAEQFGTSDLKTLFEQEVKNNYSIHSGRTEKDTTGTQIESIIGGTLSTVVKTEYTTTDGSKNGPEGTSIIPTLKPMPFTNSSFDITLTNLHTGDITSSTDYPKMKVCVKNTGTDNLTDIKVSKVKTTNMEKVTNGVPENITGYIHTLANPINFGNLAIGQTKCSTDVVFKHKWTQFFYSASVMGDGLSSTARAITSDSSTLNWNKQLPATGCQVIPDFVNNPTCVNHGDIYEGVFALKYTCPASEKDVPISVKLSNTLSFVDPGSLATAGNVGTINLSLDAGTVVDKTINFTYKTNKLTPELGNVFTKINISGTETLVTLPICGTNGTYNSGEYVGIGGTTIANYENKTNSNYDRLEIGSVKDSVNINGTTIYPGYTFDGTSLNNMNRNSCDLYYGKAQGDLSSTAMAKKRLFKTDYYRVQPDPVWKNGYKLEWSKFGKGCNSKYGCNWNSDVQCWGTHQGGSNRECISNRADGKFQDYTSSGLNEGDRRIVYKNVNLYQEIFIPEGLKLASIPGFTDKLIPNVTGDKICKASSYDKTLINPTCVPGFDEVSTGNGKTLKFYLKIKTLGDNYPTGVQSNKITTQYIDSVQKRIEGHTGTVTDEFKQQNAWRTVYFLLETDTTGADKVIKSSLNEFDSADKLLTAKTYLNVVREHRVVKDTGYGTYGKHNNVAQYTRGYCGGYSTNNNRESGSWNNMSIGIGGCCNRHCSRHGGCHCTAHSRYAINGNAGGWGSHYELNKHKDYGSGVFGANHKTYLTVMPYGQKYQGTNDKPYTGTFHVTQEFGKALTTVSSCNTDLNLCSMGGDIYSVGGFNISNATNTLANKKVADTFMVSGTSTTNNIGTGDADELKVDYIYENPKGTKSDKRNNPSHYCDYVRGAIVPITKDSVPGSVTTSGGNTCFTTWFEDLKTGKLGTVININDDSLFSNDNIYLYNGQDINSQLNIPTSWSQIFGLIDNVFYKDGDLTIGNNPTDYIKIHGKGTIFVSGDLHINSNLIFDDGVVSNLFLDRYKVGNILFVAGGNIIIHPEVNVVNGNHFTDNNFYTCGKTETASDCGSREFLLLGQVAAQEIFLNRRALTKGIKLKDSSGIEHTFKPNNLSPTCFTSNGLRNALNAPKGMMNISTSGVRRDH